MQNNLDEPRARTPEYCTTRLLAAIAQSVPARRLQGVNKTAIAAACRPWTIKVGMYIAKRLVGKSFPVVIGLMADMLA
jgi:hypothetical protein